MEVYINSNLVDLTLENEKYLFEIMAILDQTINSHNDFIKEIYINSEKVDIEECFKSEMSLVDIEKLEFKTESILSQAEHMLKHIRAMIVEIQKFSADEQVVAEHKEQLLEILEGIYRTLDDTSNILYVPFIYVFKDGLFLKDDVAGLTADRAQLLEKIRNNTVFIDILRNITLPRLQNIQNLFIPQMVKVYNLFFAKDQEYLGKEFFQNILDIKEDINVVFETIGDVGILFQMGKDTQGVKGLEKLLLIYEFVSQLILRSSLLQLIEPEKIKPIQEKLQENIKLMDQALAQKDIITLSDMLEYEYFPNMQELIELLPVTDTKD